MAERVQKTHSTTLFVASVGDTRFEPTDGMAISAFIHFNNNDLTGPKIAGSSRCVVGSSSADSRRQGGHSATFRQSAKRSQQDSGRKT